jgi:hypothetical protein
MRSSNSRRDAVSAMKYNSYNDSERFEWQSFTLETRSGVRIACAPQLDRSHSATVEELRELIAAADRGEAMVDMATVIGWQTMRARGSGMQVIAPVAGWAGSGEVVMPIDITDDSPHWLLMPGDRLTPGMVAIRCEQRIHSMRGKAGAS